ncbi:MAG: cation diffusion facilitator family transporter [Tepidibacter sp.]|uniref:cation diffusion facilitator family transporter n=1 Tax=Tepidibacter sp. TaxID=2529387 RepID=UPI0025CFBBC1|nr:cation diffusion facilitator family transporter [Tepidibacter sp.]MCT4508801.1 cation diffusion facilitator family transporter [Tepidibacter sp.]
MSYDNYYNNVKKTLIFILILNLIVAFSKVFYGYYTNVSSMIADGIHSLGDSLSNVIGILAIYISSKPPDDTHPYGHEKFETLASIFISLLLFSMSLKIITNSYNKLLNPTLPNINIYNFIIMILTLIINFFVSVYESKKGKELKSEILISDSVHTQSDIYVSISVLVSLFTIKMGFIILDIIISFIISMLIIKASFEILIPAIKVLCDGAMIDANHIHDFVIKIDKVLYCNNIRTHGKENRIRVDLTIGVDKFLTLESTHLLSHYIEDMIILEFNGVKEVIIHIEPCDNRKTDS